MKNRLYYSCYYNLTNHFYNNVESQIYTAAINSVEVNVSYAVNTGITVYLRHVLLRLIKDNLSIVIRNI